MLVILERMRDVAIDLDFLAKSFFYFDQPVPYKLEDGHVLNINPILVKDSEIFLSSIDLITIDKNSLPDPKIIQMSYLQFINDVLLIGDRSRVYLQKFVNLLVLCLGMKNPFIFKNERGKPYLVEGNHEYTINHRQFEDIRRIVLYQNILHFDDSYINPEAKAAMNQVDILKNQDYEDMTIERKMAIITAHSGVLKKDQIEMTLRSHTILFEEICGEVEFTTTRPVAMFAGKGKELPHWIHKKKKNKFNDYFISDKAYHKSMGGDGNLTQTITDSPNFFEQQFNNFKK